MISTRRKFLLILFCLFLISSLAYWQTLQMHFWKDDAGLMYKLQRPNEPIGFLGYGITGDGPYRHIVDQFILFYPIFGLNPQGYFAIGIILYWLASISVYLFVKKLTKIEFVSVASSFIFASGYIGSESIFGLINSWQTSRGIIMANICFITYLYYLENKKIWIYLLSLILFFFSIDTVFIRAHGLIFIIIALDLLFGGFKFKIRSGAISLLRLLPFIFINYKIYFENPVSPLGAKSIISDIFLQGKYYLILNPFQSIGNIFVPDKLTGKLDKVFNITVSLQRDFSFNAVLVGIVVSVIAIILIFRNRKKETFLSKLILFSYIFIVVNIIAYIARETNLILYTTHRYLSYSLEGVAILFSTLILLFSKKYHFEGKHISLTLPLLLIVTVYLLLGNQFQYQFNQTRSIPTKKFYSEFKKLIPTISEGDVIYVDIANEPSVRSEYASFFGDGMLPNAAGIALFYNIDYQKFIFTQNFKDLSDFLSNNPKEVEKIKTFYYNGSNLEDTTSLFRKLIFSGDELQINKTEISSTTDILPDTDFISVSKLEKKDSLTIGTSQSINISPAKATSIIPSKLSFDILIELLAVTTPYQNSSFSGEDIKDKQISYLYLTQRLKYRNEASASAVSYWEENLPRNVLDGRIDTLWWGSRGYWNDFYKGAVKNPESLKIDLGKIESISGVSWVSGHKINSPIDYQILISEDGQIWKLAKEVKRQETTDNTRVVDKFDDINARFIRFDVYKTPLNDAPDLTEFEVIPSIYKEINFDSVEALEKSPFSRIDNQTELSEAMDYIKNASKLKVYWQANNDWHFDKWKFKEVPVLIDGYYHTVQVEIPAGGTMFKQFIISGVDFPSRIHIRNVRLRYGFN